MSDTAISVNNLGKMYRITHQQSGYRTMREELVNLMKRPFQRGESNARSEAFWALKDISFEVKVGEVLGIIGRNGAGKSTLLKILSRITQPTEGYAEVFGRVGSLLEVGTGFHPELTGRENIFLNGAILGMTRADIRRNFDEIVAFAEVEKFIDTPVKRYSSGMYMRLAFSVAAHLEPEVLVIDEVLAVGDAKFQDKCIGKMGAVAQSGRTVLFVSHNMAAVQQLCKTGILLENGQIAYAGKTPEVISRYMVSNANAAQSNAIATRKDRTGAGHLRFVRIEFCDADGNTIGRVLSGQDVHIRFHYVSDTLLDTADVNVAFNVYNPMGLILTNLNSKDVAKTAMPIGESGYFECHWSRFNLRSGVYTCALICEVNGVIEDWLQSAFQIHVDDGNYHGTGSLIDRGQGDILVAYDWDSQVTNREMA